MTPPISQSNIELKINCRGLVVDGWTVRHVSPVDEDDSGWRLQAVLRNDSGKTLENVDCDLRYYDVEDKFLGLDDGMVFISDMDAGRDEAVSIDLNVPDRTHHAAFAVRGSRKSPFDVNSSLALTVLLLFIVYIVANHVL
ncbi:MAG: hypothetical protein CMJ49_07600 [Planctomycetaceae bacterium]|nr:hypothetical protein [Planctomycetaceae bacterium]